MTEWLRLHIVPAEAWSLSPSPHTAGSQLPITPPLQDLTVSSGLCENLHSRAYIYTQSHTYNMHIIKTKMHLFFFLSQRQLDIPTCDLSHGETESDRSLSSMDELQYERHCLRKMDSIFLWLPQHCMHTFPSQRLHTKEK